MEEERASLLKEVEKTRGELVERKKEFDEKLEVGLQREELLRTSIDNAQREIEELKNTVNCLNTPNSEVSERRT